MSKAPFSNEAFRDFCIAQGEEEYHYADCFSCAISQYLKSLGIKTPIVGSLTWNEIGEQTHHFLPNGWNKTVVTEPRTFKALAERLRERA